MMDYREQLIGAMANLDEARVMELVRHAAEAGCSSSDIQSFLNIGMDRVGRLFESGEYFIADLIVSGMIYRSALNLLLPLSGGRSALPIGRVVIGVVAGDIHDIGKDIVVSMLRAERFEVIDLGIDVKPERFAYAIRTYRPDVLLLSGVLTIAQESMRTTMKHLRKENLRDQVSVLIGGLCASEFLKNDISADGWAYDPNDTVQFCKQVVEKKYGKEGTSTDTLCQHL